jgi:hypothetical protein
VGQAQEHAAEDGDLPAWVNEHFRQKQFVLLRLLWGKGEVPIREVHQAIYDCADGREESLDKVKDRTNRKLAEIGQPYEIISRRGEVFVLIKLR